MSVPSRATALIHAKDLQRMWKFHQTLLGRRLVHADADHHVIESAQLQLIVHAIPAHFADTFEIVSAPELREEQAIKLLLTIPSLAGAFATAAALGGGFVGHAHSAAGVRVRDGHDPEGNIFQLREHAH